MDSWIGHLCWTWLGGVSDLVPGQASMVRHVCLTDRRHVSIRSQRNVLVGLVLEGSVNIGGYEMIFFSFSLLFYLLSKIRRTNLVLFRLL